MNSEMQPEAAVLWQGQSAPHSTQCALTFAGDPVHVTELVAASAVTLVGAIDVGTLLAAGAVEAFIHI